ncbi:hypothetical protein [Weissella sagaensis]|uniref:hypothetical protein n=1 Tax=Weissella sagaensis TaxID=2559928 RepID=UPI0013ED098E|nr:hypothetical protein [Weissella sagaensis]
MLKGKQMALIDERERLAVLANSIAYFSNAKKPKFKKVFDRAKEERALNDAYESNLQENTNAKRLELHKQLADAFGERS